MNAAKGNTRSFFSFLLSVARAYPGQKIYMVLDNVAYHHANRLKPVLQLYYYRLELVFLPPYSPDLNPMERIWWYMRKKITHNRFVETLDMRISRFEHLFSQFDKPNLTCKNLSNLIENIY